MRDPATNDDVPTPARPHADIRTVATEVLRRVEEWRHAPGWRDDELRALARVVRGRNPQVVLIRWGHEMELGGSYPWAANHPVLYRAAFRHVVELFRAEGVENARWVWSPAGDPGAAAYFPGHDVVDYVGITVLVASLTRPPPSSRSPPARRAAPR